MSASNVIIELRKKLGVSRLKLAKMIGLKTNMIIWQYEKGQRFPSRTTWMNIIDIAEQNGIRVTAEMMKEER